MTTRRRKTTEEPKRIPQDELENFFMDVAPKEVKKIEEERVIKKERVRPAKTGKIFLNEEDIRQFNAYKKFLKETQGITNVRHKKI